MRGDITFVVIVDASHPAPAFNVPPRASIASAICVALFVLVPRVNRDAVISAAPDRSVGSTSPPLLMISCAVTSGISVRGITITRKPFGKFFSTGLGKTVKCGAVGGGGVACAVCAAELIAHSASTRIASIQFEALFLISRLLPSRHPSKDYCRKSSAAPTQADNR